MTAPAETAAYSLNTHGGSRHAVPLGEQRREQDRRGILGKPAKRGALGQFFRGLVVSFVNRFAFFVTTHSENLRNWRISIVVHTMSPRKENIPRRADEPPRYT